MKRTWDRRQFGILMAFAAVMPGSIALAQHSPKGVSTHRPDDGGIGQ